MTSGRGRAPSQPPPPRQDSAGFTLLEVMIAVLLTAVATSGIVGLYKVQTRASGYSRRQTEATVLAQDGLEELRAARSVSYGTVTETGLNELGLPVANGIFSRDLTVASQLGYEDLTVTVRWVEDGENRSVVMRSRRGVK